MWKSIVIIYIKLYFMNTKQLANRLAKKMGYSQKEMYPIVSNMIELIKECVIEGHVVKLNELLSIRTEIRDEHKYFNASNLQVEQKPKRFVLKIIVSKTFKRVIDAKKAY